MPKMSHPKQDARALALHRAGVSYRDIGARMRPKKSEGWARVAVKRAIAAEGDAQDAPPEADAPELDLPDAGSSECLPEAGTTLEKALRQKARLDHAHDVAVRDGNHGAAQRYMRDSVGLMTLIARLEKQHAGDEDVVTIPRAEAANASARVLDNLRRLQARPLTCAHCGRELRMTIARGGEA